MKNGWLSFTRKNKEGFKIYPNGETGVIEVVILSPDRDNCLAKIAVRADSRVKIFRNEIDKGWKSQHESKEFYEKN